MVQRARSSFRPLCALALALSILAAAPAQAVPVRFVTVNGVQWAQVADFTNLSWNDVSAGTSGTDPTAGPCSEVTGACSGTLNGFDVTGWTWASIEDVGALFKYVTETYNDGDDANHPGGIANVINPDHLSGWAPAFIDTIGFEVTFLACAPPVRGVAGLARTVLISTDEAWLATVTDAAAAQSTCAVPQSTFDIAASALPNPLTTPLNSLGHWLFSAQPVPAPAPGLLVASGLAGMAWLRRRRRVS